MKKIVSIALGCLLSGMAQGQFTAGNLVVLRLGDSVATLANTGNLLAIDQFSPSGSFVNTTFVNRSGSNAVCLSGTASSEGQLTLSTDNNSINFIAYKTAAPYSSSLSATAASVVNRTVVSIHAAGSISLPTSTASGFSANNPRCAFSNGTGFWGVGANTGICYGTASSNLDTIVSSTITNIRYAGIFGGQLYVSTGSGSSRGIYRVGAGAPTGSGNTSVNYIPTGSGSSPFAFAINADSTVCYIADDQANGSGGIQKWTRSGSTWSMAYNLGSGVVNIGARSLTVSWSGTYPVIYATTAEATANRLISITDSSASAVVSTLATAAANTIFRGVAFAPFIQSAPVYSIATIAHTNASTGNPDSVNVKVRVRGVGYGFNQQAGGIGFVLRDGTGGITVQNSSNNFGYTAFAEGDSVEASGTVISNRGLAQITLDTIIYLAGNRPLKSPVLITKPDENAENDLVQVNNVHFLNPPAGSNWPGSSSNIQLLNASNDTIVLHLHALSGLAGKPLPATPTFSVVGLGRQVSSSPGAPFAFDGYQVMPRQAADIIEITSDSIKAFGLLAPISATVLTLDSPLTATVKFTWQKGTNYGSLAPATYTWELDTISGSFTTPVATHVSAIGGSDTTLTLDKSTLLGYMTAKGYGSGKVFNGKWRVKAVSGPVSRISSNIFNLNLTIPATGTGVTPLQFDRALVVYPNPASISLYVTNEVMDIQVLEIYSLQGIKIKSLEVNACKANVQLHDLARGIYFLKVYGLNGQVATRKISVQ